MDVLDQSDELLRRCGELRARSVGARAAADKTMEKSGRLIPAAARADEAVKHACSLEPAALGGRATADDLPAAP